MYIILLTARRYAGAVYAVTVCPSVRPFVASLCSTKTAKHTITQTSPYDSPVTLVFSDVRNIGEIPTGWRRGGATGRVT